MGPPIRFWATAPQNGPNGRVSATIDSNGHRRRGRQLPRPATARTWLQRLSVVAVLVACLIGIAATARMAKATSVVEGQAQVVLGEDPESSRTGSNEERTIQEALERERDFSQPPDLQQPPVEDRDSAAPLGVLLSNTGLVMAVALIAVLVSEAAAWIFVYRTAEYGTLLAGVGNSWRKLQEMKDPRRRTGSARIKSQDSIFQERNRKLSTKRMIAGLLSSIVYLLLLPSFKRSFHGVAVLQLPFQPIWFFKSLAFHSLSAKANLVNYGSAMFLYVLAVGFFRTNIQKLMGYAPPPSIAANTGLAGMLAPSSEPDNAVPSTEPTTSNVRSR